MAIATASISGKNRIVLKAGYTQGAAEHEEGELVTAAYPGQNVQMGVATEVMQRHQWNPGNTDNVGTGTSTTTTKNPVRVLKEDALQGKTILDQYAANSGCFVHIAKPGDVLQVLVLTGQNIAKGDGLSANSTGKWVGDATNAAVEAIESSGGALAADTHMRVRVL